MFLFFSWWKNNFSKKKFKKGLKTKTICFLFLFFVVVVVANVSAGRSTSLRAARRTTLVMIIRSSRGILTNIIQGDYCGSHGILIHIIQGDYLWQAWDPNPYYTGWLLWQAWDPNPYYTGWLLWKSWDPNPFYTGWLFMAVMGSQPILYRVIICSSRGILTHIIQGDHLWQSWDPNPCNNPPFIGAQVKKHSTNNPK